MIDFGSTEVSYAMDAIQVRVSRIRSECRSFSGCFCDDFKKFLLSLSL